MRLLIALFTALFLAAPVSAETISLAAEEETAAITFGNEEAVIEYLEEGTYVGNGLVVNIKHNGVYANGRLITGAVSIERYNNEVALISMTPPGYDRVYFRVDVLNRCLIDNQGLLYLRER